MNLCVQRLCKKKGGTREKKEGKRISSLFEDEKTGLSQLDAPDTISLFIFLLFPLLLLLLDESLASKRFEDISRSTTSRAPFGFFIPLPAKFVK